MAYLRKDKQTVEVNYSFNKVWEAIAKAIPNLEWKIEEKNEERHQVIAKTKGNLLAYASRVTIEANAIGENKTHVKVSVETPTTTITGIIDFGKSRERIDLFLLMLAKQLKTEKSGSTKENK